jgi:Cellulase (glycosyl hydrolase family 5)
LTLLLLKHEDFPALRAAYETRWFPDRIKEKGPRMNTSQTEKKIIAVVALAAMVANVTASAAALCIDAVNPQYFYYEGKTTPLVGYTPEYICHLEQRPNTPQLTQLCNYGNYALVIDELARKHLNVLRVWVGLGHSPGGAAGPLPHEQPFAYDAAQRKWDLYTWDQTYFDRLKQVVAYAETNHVIVELTLFDALSGDFRTSPWYLGKNSNGYIGLSDAWTLTAAPGTTCKPFSSTTNIYSRQQALVEKLVNELNDHDNIYWELANEPELSLASSGGIVVPDSVSVPRIVKWHECMTDILRNAEGIPTAPKRHLIAANYHTLTALAPFRTIISPAYAPDVKILTGHYIKVRDPGRFSATEKQRNYLNLGLQGINRVYGFNEGRPTPSYRTDPRFDFDYITPDEARAEAWEFMLSEGGIYNHYTTDWASGPNGQQEPLQTRVQLGKLADFLAGLGPNLRHMGRSINDPPTWAPNLPVYATSRGNSNVYWGAMHQNGSTYVLYVHHSTLSDDGFKAYRKPDTSITRLRKIDLQPTVAPVNYTAEWIDPATGSRIGDTFDIVANGARMTYDVPAYSYDIALKITNGITTPSTGTCAP